MNPMLAGTVILAVLLAAMNGANDDAKGVATLAGAGVTRYRTALLWGVLATLAGSVLSLAFASRMTALFSAGIVTAPPTLAFAAAVLLGALTWVGLATVFRLPVSTTHAIVGGLIGAGLQLAPGAIHWSALVRGVALPLVVSVLVAYALSAALNLVRRPAAQCTCVDITPMNARFVPAGQVAAWRTSELSLPVIQVVRGTEAECQVHPRTGSRLAVTMTGAHWLTSGATSFARGLNDTPKIVAIGAFGLSGLGSDARWLLLPIAVAMALGGLLAGVRVGRVLGDRVVNMSHAEGFRANAVSAVMVGLGANLGLPMSTTHVVTGAIAGAAGRDLRRLNRQLLRDFVLAWTVTPVVAGLVSAFGFALLQRA